MFVHACVRVCVCVRARVRAQTNCAAGGQVTSIYAVLATDFFGEQSQEFFGTFSVSIFTLFQVSTGDAWASIVARSLLYRVGSDGELTDQVCLRVYVCLSACLPVCLSACLYLKRESAFQRMRVRITVLADTDRRG